MEKRTLLAVIISILILFIYQEFFIPAPSKTGKEISTPEKIAPVPQEKTTNIPSAEGKAGETPTSPLSPTIESQPGREITVDTPLYSAVFDTRGARLKDWRVKKYLDKIGPGAKPIDLAAEQLGNSNPFGLEITGSNFPLSTQPLFQANEENLTLGPGKGEGELIFTWNSPEGLQIVQRISFYADSYRMNIQLGMTNLSAHSFEGRPMFVWAGKIFTTPGSKGMACVPGSGGASGPEVPPFIILANGDRQELGLNDLKEEKNFTQKIRWGGFQSKYFLAALIPQKNEGTEITLKKTSNLTGNLEIGGPKVILLPQTQISQSYILYLGPKDLSVLKASGFDLDRALKFGWFDVVAKPILYLMNFFYKFLGNYGLAIIFLTVIIKILFWYPTHISYKSMRDMKRIQPEMAKIKEKFKDNQEKMNKEMMELYRRYKINPLGGCLPILIQIPIFYALYKILAFSIEIRQAPFYWWIRDLSAPDPYYISPILMGASMFVQQWLTPVAGDPTQAKMMLFMPVVFTFMFLNFPTGLVIYWLFSNLISIGQQLYINKKFA